METRADVGSMDSGMATCSPAGSSTDKTAVVRLADGDLAARNLELRMTFQAEVVIALNQQFPIDRAVGLMTDRAAFAHGLVLEHHRPGLLPMTLGARFVQAGHRQAARRLHDVAAMWIVALDTVHPRFDHRVMTRQIEFRVDLQMTLITACRILPWIDDELAPASARRYMFASGPVTRLTTGAPRQFQILFVKPTVWTCGKNARDVGVAISAGFVSDKRSSFNFRWSEDSAVQGGARTQHQANQS